RWEIRSIRHIGVHAFSSKTLCSQQWGQNRAVSTPSSLRREVNVTELLPFCYVSEDQKSSMVSPWAKRSMATERISTLRTFPVTVVGNSSTIWTYRGILYFARELRENSRSASAVSFGAPLRSRIQAMSSSP